MKIKTDRSILSLLKTSSVRVLGAQVVPTNAEEEETRLADQLPIGESGCHIDKQGLVVFQRTEPIGKGNRK